MDWASCALFIPNEKQKELPILGSDTKHRICLINAFDKRQLSNNMVMQLKSNLIWKIKGNITGNYEFNTGFLMETLSKISENKYYVRYLSQFIVSFFSPFPLGALWCPFRMNTVYLMLSFRKIRHLALRKSNLVVAKKILRSFVKLTLMPELKNWIKCYYKTFG